MRLDNGGGAEASRRRGFAGEGWGVSEVRRRNGEADGLIDKSRGPTDIDRRDSIGESIGNGIVDGSGL